MYSLLDVTLSLLDGFKTTLSLFGLTLLFALPLGLLISFGSMSRFSILSYITKVFVWIIRGTPLMLQILVVFYVPVLFFGTHADIRTKPLFGGSDHLCDQLLLLFFGDLSRGYRVDSARTVRSGAGARHDKKSDIL